jgi:hypothetical protein
MRIKTHYDRYPRGVFGGGICFGMLIGSQAYWGACAVFILMMAWLWIAEDKDANP